MISLLSLFTGKMASLFTLPEVGGLVPFIDDNCHERHVPNVQHRLERVVK